MQVPCWNPKTGSLQLQYYSFNCRDISKSCKQYFKNKYQKQCYCKPCLYIYIVLSEGLWEDSSLTGHSHHLVLFQILIFLILKPQVVSYKIPVKVVSSSLPESTSKSWDHKCVPSGPSPRSSHGFSLPLFVCLLAQD